MIEPAVLDEFLPGLFRGFGIHACIDNDISVLGIDDVTIGIVNGQWNRHL